MNEKAKQIAAGVAAIAVAAGVVALSVETKGEVCRDTIFACEARAPASLLDDVKGKYLRVAIKGQACTSAAGVSRQVVTDSRATIEWRGLNIVPGSCVETDSDTEKGATLTGKVGLPALPSQCACSTGSNCERLFRAPRQDAGWVTAPTGLTFQPGEWRGLGCLEKPCASLATFDKNKKLVDETWPQSCPP